MSASRAAPWASLEGLPFPLGATWVPQEEAWNFAVYSEHAEQVTLLLYAEADPSTTVVAHRLDHLRNKSGPVWHCRVPAAEHAYQGVNFVTSHDGFTLWDLVSYERKRNWANGHDNTDGTDDNLSSNCGWEGDEGAPPEVIALRKRQAKNFLCLLLLANGTPMLRAGDEFLHTQGGNNNPYNQDNETSWLDWRLLDAHPDVFRFARLMIAFRKAHPSLCRSRFWRDDVRWYGVGPQVDLSDASRSLAFCLRGASQGDDDVYVLINAYREALDFTVQEGAPAEWRRIVDTGRESPDDICEAGQEVLQTSARYTVGPRSVVVLVRPRRS